MCVVGPAALAPGAAGDHRRRRDCCLASRACTFNPPCPIRLARFTGRCSELTCMGCSCRGPARHMSSPWRSARRFQTHSVGSTCVERRLGGQTPRGAGGRRGRASRASAAVGSRGGRAMPWESLLCTRDRVRQHQVSEPCRHAPPHTVRCSCASSAEGGSGWARTIDRLRRLL